MIPNSTSDDTWNDDESTLAMFGQFVDGIHNFVFNAADFSWPSDFAGPSDTPEADALAARVRAVR